MQELEATFFILLDIWHLQMVCCFLANSTTSSILVGIVSTLNKMPHLVGFKTCFKLASELVLTGQRTSEIPSSRVQAALDQGCRIELDVAGMKRGMEQVKSVFVRLKKIFPAST